MTTESQPRTSSGTPPRTGAVGAAVAAGAVAVAVLLVVALLAADGPAVVGVLVGGGVTLAVFAAGVAFVGLAARLVPAASLLVALLTYTLQLLVLALTVAVLERSGVADETLSRGWFAGAVIAVTMLWLAGQLVGSLRQRIPAYDLSEESRLVEHPGGER